LRRSPEIFPPAKEQRRRGNFPRARRSNRTVNPAALFVPHLRRLRARMAALFADLPIVFLAVVLGVALTFRVAIGWAKEGATPEPPAVSALAAPTVAPAATTGTAARPVVMAADPQATALPAGTAASPGPFARPPRAKVRRPR
jgi:hypothetical protein